MLLPDNIQPELSIYYNGAVVLSALQKQDKQIIFSLYEKVKAVNDMSFPTFILSLDWLYLIEAARITKGGYVEVCS